MPRTSYKLSLDIDSFLSDHLYIVRRSDLSCEDTFNSVGGLKDEVIAQERVPGLSMNLLGSVYEALHTKYSAKGNGSAPWTGQKVLLSKHLNDYIKHDVFCPIFYKIVDLHDIQIPFVSAQSKEAKKFLASFNLKATETNQNYILHGKIQIWHSPTNLNYWHVELKLFDARGEEISKVKNQWEKSSTAYILEHILGGVAIKTLQEPVAKIPKSHFLKGSSEFKTV